MDGWKHIPVPPAHSSAKIVYVYGDIDIICANAVRRGWVRRQGAKLGQPLCAITWGRVQQGLYRRAVEHQMAAFLADKSILTVRYEELWDRISEIGAHLSISDPAFVQTLPPKRERLTTLPADDSSHPSRPVH